MSAKGFLKNLIGIEDDEDYEITPDEIEAERRRMQAEGGYSSGVATSSEPIEPMTGISNMAFSEVVPPISFNKSNTVDPKVSMNVSSQFKMVVIEPRSLDECRKLVDNLKARKPVIVNLEKVETELARKMFDFLGGATYALNGTVQRVTQNIFIFAPNNVNINAKLDRATEAGKTASSNPWK
ncbi:MAG: cell division protein SepF [Clostridiales bacterium]|nr:cell division protein SepF [Candidatus Crickella caballi]